MKKLSLLSALGVIILGQGVLWAQTAGWYSGKTSENLGVGFRITGNTVDSIRFTFKAYNNTGYVKDTTHSARVSATISANSFTAQKVMVDTSIAPYWRIDGNFAAGNTVNSKTTLYYVRRDYSDASQRRTSGSSPPTYTGAFIHATTNTPPVPTGVSLRDTTANQLVLSWSAVAAAYRYRIDVSTDGSNYSQLALTSNLQYVHSGLTYGGRYWYRVRADGVWGSSNYAAAQNRYVEPPTPSGLAVSGATASTVSLNWNATTGATSYAVFASTASGGPYTQVGTPASPSYTVVGFVANTLYYFRVAAVNSGGASTQSGWVSKRTPPATPTGLVAQSTSPAVGIALSWASATGAARYRIYRSATVGGVYAFIDTTSATSYIQSGLLGNTTYYYRIKSLASGGDSSVFSSIVSALTVPAAPGMPAATVESPYSVNLSWSTVPGASLYTVRRWSGSAWDSVAATTTTTYRVLGLGPNRTHYFQIGARNAAGSGSYSSYSTSITPAAVATSFPLWQGFETAPSSSWSLLSSLSTGRNAVVSTGAPYRESGHLQMDVTTSATPNLNEAIVAVNLAGQSGDLLFWHKHTGDEEHPLPANWQGSYLGDGVALSIDGLNWVRVQGLVQADGISASWKAFGVSLDSVAAAAGFALANPTYIKFQQFDDFPSPSDGFFFDEIRVIARPTLTIEAGAGGSISPSGVQRVPYGSSLTLNIIPAVNYQIESVLLDGVEQGALSVLSLDSIISPHLVNASFRLVDRIITASSGAGGVISPQGAVLVPHGGSQEFQFTPAEGYEVEDVLVNGVSQGVIHSYTFPGVLSNQSIAVSWRLRRYEISAIAGSGGAISPAGNSLVNHGANQEYDFLPSEGYEVDSVLVDGVSIGSVASYTFNTVTAVHSISAFFKLRTYRLVARSIGNGSISPTDTLWRNHGANQTFTFTPETGYEVATVRVDGLALGSMPDYSFSQLADNHEIEVQFRRQTYPIYAGSGTGGVILPAGTIAVEEGSSQSFAIQPNEGYEIDSVVVNGVSMGAVDAYEFSAVQAAHSIQAYFKIKNYAVQASAGPNGSISPSGTLVVNHGSQRTFSIQASDGYTVLDVVLNGESLGALASYTIENITGPQTLHASFAPRIYTIQATSGAGGSMDPSGAVELNYGQSQAFVFTPDLGREISDVVIDGLSWGPLPNYQFSQVRDDHTLLANFTEQTHLIHVMTSGKGAVIPNGSVPIPHGASQIFDITPSKGTSIGDVRVDGVSVGVVSSYNFENVTQSATLEVIFVPREFDISITSGPGGSVSLEGELRLRQDDDLYLQIYPRKGFVIEDVVLDGESLGAVNEIDLPSIRNSHIIHATFQPQSLIIYSEADGNGSISPEGKIPVDFGGSYTYNFTPESGFAVQQVYVDGFSIGPVPSYTFHEVTEDHEILVEFGEIPPGTVLVSITAGSGGSISPEGNFPFRYGADLVVRITPSWGYEIADILVDGKSADVRNQLSFPRLREPLQIEALFAPIEYEITLKAGGGGNIEAPDGATIPHDNNARFNFAPEPGYQVDSVWVDDIFVGKPDYWEFTEVQREHTVLVSFAKEQHRIIALATPGGTLSPGGVFDVNLGESLTLEVIPSIGYEVDSVIVDGISLGAVSQVVLPEIENDHAIRAYFKRRMYPLTATAGEGGSVFPTGTVYVQHGSNRAVQIQPLIGYEIDSLRADGLMVDTTSIFLFTNVQSPHTLDVNFKRKQYAVQVAAESGGTISPAADTTISHGDSLRLSFHPQLGYEVDSVVLDGQNMGNPVELLLADLTAEHSVGVWFRLRSYPVALSASAGGSTTPQGVVGVLHGDSLPVRFVPDEGFRMDSARVDGAWLAMDSLFVFRNVSGPRNLEARFVPRTYQILASAGDGGTISPAGTTVVTHGTGRSYSISVQSGYQIDSVRIDGISVGAIAQYTFTDIQADHDIEAFFSVRRYTVLAQAHPGGSISPQGELSYLHGADEQFTVTPDEGYQLDSVRVNEQNLGAVSQWGFADLHADQSIHAYFSRKSYRFLATTPGGGSIAPTGLTTVLHGNSQSYTLVPAEGYEIAFLAVDGDTLESVTTWTDSAAHRDRLLEAYFRKKQYSLTISDDSGGVVVPSGTLLVEHGNSQTIILQPANGFVVDTLWLDDVAQEDFQGSEFVLDSIHSAHTVAVTFRPRTWSVSVSASVGGSISPTGVQSVREGQPLLLTAQAESGQRLLHWLVDGENMGSSPQLYLPAVERAYTVRAEFTAVTGDSVVVVVQPGTGGRAIPTDSIPTAIGSDILVNFLPDWGYRLDSLFLDGVAVAASASYRLEAVEQSHLLRAQFALREWPVQILAYGSGVASPAGGSYLHGSSPQFSWMPSPGFRVDSVKVAGVSSDSLATLTLDSLNGPVQVEVWYGRKQYKIAIAGGSGGSLSPTGHQWVSHGDSLLIHINAQPAHVVSQVWHNGVELGSISSLLLRDIRDSHFVMAQFVQATMPLYAITSTAGPGGLLLPNGAVSVPAGGGLRVAVHPQLGYQMDTLWVDGQRIDSAAGYYFRNVQADRQIHAVFKPTEYPVQIQGSAGGELSSGTDTVLTLFDTLRVAFSPRAGYRVDSVIVNGLVIADSLQGFTLQGVQAPTVLRVVFAPLPYAVTLIAGVGGGVTPQGVATVLHGNFLSLVPVPNMGYQLAQLTAEHSSLGWTSQGWRVGPVLQADTVRLTFEPQVLAVRITEDSAAVLEISDTAVVYGDSLRISWDIAENEQLHTLLANGVEVNRGAENFVWIPAVTQNLDLVARVGPRQHRISLHCHGPGTCTGAADTLVAHGDSYSVSWSIPEGSQLDSVRRDGVAIDSIDSYQWNPVQGESSIHAYFSRARYAVHVRVHGEGEVGGGISTYEVEHGESLQLPVRSDLPFGVDSVFVNDRRQVLSGDNIELSDITDSLVVDVYFGVQQRRVFVRTGSAGAALPGNEVVVDRGDSLRVRIVPMPGFGVSDVAVNGESVGALLSILLDQVLEDTEVEVGFHRLGASGDSAQRIRTVQISVESLDEILHFDVWQLSHNRDTVVHIAIADTVSQSWILVVNGVRQGEGVDSVRIVANAWQTHIKVLVGNAAIPLQRALGVTGPELKAVVHGRMLQVMGLRQGDYRVWLTDIQGTLARDYGVLSGGITHQLMLPPRSSPLLWLVVQHTISGQTQAIRIRELP